MRLWLLLVLIGLSYASCDRDPEGFTPVEEPPREISLTLPYDMIPGTDPNLLSLDIYHDTKTEVKKPVVVYVHGGGWSIGDKANNIRDKVNLFRGAGYLFVSINYRLSPNPFQTDNPDRIKYPVHNQDVAGAIRWIYDNIEAYGGKPDQLALLGHSAGAHLVALTGTNFRFLDEVGVPRSIIRGVAPIDTRGYEIPPLVDDDLYLNAFGNDPIENREASPLFNVEEGTTYPPFFVAKRGSNFRKDFSNRFIAALVDVGTEVQEVDGSIYDHAGINAAIGQEEESLITDPLLDFLRACFGE
jgi:arylformamidase